VALVPGDGDYGVGWSRGCICQGTRLASLISSSAPAARPARDSERSARVDSIAPLAVVLAVGWSLLLWLFTPLTLLDRRVSRRMLLPGAAATTVGLLAAGVWAEIVIPGEIERYVGRDGLIGVAVALVSYFLALSFVIVGGAVFAAALAGHGEADSTAAFSRSYSASSRTPRV
jgi:uncharacterized BrkB/YihY/UPF0761 family membrane protein